MIPALDKQEREFRDSFDSPGILDRFGNPVSFNSRQTVETQDIRRRGNHAIVLPDKYQKISDAIGPAIVADRHIKAEKEPSRIIQPNGPRDGYILDPNDFGSGMISPPGGNYYQTGKIIQQPGYSGYNDFFSIMISSLFKEVSSGIKENMYRVLTEWPLSLRDVLFAKLNATGPVADWITSILQLGWHNGPLQATIDDFFYDRLEFIKIKETNQLVGIRSVNTRPESGIVKLLRSPDKYGRYVPRGGRLVESLDDLTLSREGLIAGYKPERCGGYPVTESGLNYDEFFTKNNTLKKISHEESETPGLSTKELENMLKEFQLYMTVIRGFGGERKDLGSMTFPDIGKTYSYERILLDDWKTVNPNYILGLGSRGVGAYLFAHPLYSAMEKLAQGTRWNSLMKDIQQRELYSMFIPPEFVIKTIGYG